MKDKIHLALFFGGQSGEHEVSRVSAYNIVGAIDPEKYQLTLIGITKNGKMIRYTGPLDAIPGGEWENNRGYLVEAMDFFNDPFLQSIDICFPVLHGPMGEDGTIQGLFELINKPYVGCGVLSSAVGMDKHFSKLAFERAGIPTGPYQAYHSYQYAEDPESFMADIQKRLNYPIFVKPANMGSSVGISKVHTHEELQPALELAFEYDHKIIVEAGIDGHEIECAILEDGDTLRASTPGQIVASKEFYDYEAKYSDDEDSEIIIPAPLDPQTIEDIKTYAIKAFRAIEGSGLSRVDFFVEKTTGEIFINEINTLPGFTDISMYPKMWEADGIPYKTLVDKLIQSASRKIKTRD